MLYMHSIHIDNIQTHKRALIVPKLKFQPWIRYNSLKPISYKRLDSHWVSGRWNKSRSPVEMAKPLFTNVYEKTDSLCSRKFHLQLVPLFLKFAFQRDGGRPGQIFASQRHKQGVPWWFSRLRIWCCHCCGTGSVPVLGNSICHGCDKKKKKKSDLQIISRRWSL